MIRSRRNPVNFKKVVGSKWTAVQPIDREKHFLVVDWVRDLDGMPTDEVQLEAVLTHRVRTLHWRELEKTETWRIGWR